MSTGMNCGTTISQGSSITQCAPLIFSRADYLRTLELDADYLPARVNLAFLHQAEGRFQWAWDELSDTLERDKCEECN